MIEDSKYHKDGQYWISPYNFIPEVTDKLDLPEKVEIHDATLRDGEQTPGLSFLSKRKLPSLISWMKSASIESRQECQRFRLKTSKRSSRYPLSV